MLISITDIQLIYDRILEQLNLDYISVIIFVGFDTDAVCTLKIITGILKSETILYEVYPVASYLDLEKRIELSRAFDKVKMIFFINCGGYLDLTQKWFYSERADQQIKVFLLDVNKPIHHANLEHKHIKVVNDGHSNFDSYPTTKDFQTLESLGERDNLDSDSDYMEEESPQYMDGEKSQKNKREQEPQMGEDSSFKGKEQKQQCVQGEQESPLKRKRQIKKRQMNERKHKKIQLEQKIDNYYSKHYSSFPSSMIAFRLARDINKVSNDYLWLGMVGLTSLFLESKLSKDTYDKAEAFFSSEMIKLNSASQKEGTDVGVILRQVDFRFSMLRHWSLYESMKYSPYIVMKMKLWDDIGLDRLNEFITQIGLSLEEAKQLYSYMSIKQKNDIKNSLFKMAQEFDLLDIYFNSYRRQIDTYGSLFCSDYCSAISTALENPDPQGTPVQQQYESRIQHFWTAYHLLDDGRIQDIKHFIQSHKTYLKILISEAIGILDKSQITPCLEFLYVKIQNDTPQRHLFQHPFRLIRLGQLLMGLYHQKKRNKSKVMKPLVISIETHDSPTARVAGVVPDYKNPFGSKFILVAERNNFQKKHDDFLSNIIEIKKDDLIKFITELNLT